jgi:uncharacterized protein (TIGR00725 family)
MPLLAPTTIAVLGSGIESHDEAGAEIGALLAELGVNLLTGAGGGVMTSVSRAFTASPRTAGICIGIVPCASEEDRATPKPGYPNPFVELPIYTHLPFSGERGQHDLSRNHINVLSAQAIIALPGGAGTASEVELALRYRKPIVIYARDISAVTHFSPMARRVTVIAEVRRFVVDYIAV